MHRSFAYMHEPMHCVRTQMPSTTVTTHSRFLSTSKVLQRLPFSYIFFVALHIAFPRHNCVCRTTVCVSAGLYGFCFSHLKHKTNGKGETEQKRIIQHVIHKECVECAVAATCLPLDGIKLNIYICTRNNAEEKRVKNEIEWKKNWNALIYICI